MRGHVQNFFFCPGAGKKERHAAQGHHTDRVGEESDPHPPAQSAHFANVLFVMAAVNHRAGTEKEERFEKAVRQQMHDPSRDPAHA